MEASAGTGGAETGARVSDMVSAGAGGTSTEGGAQQEAAQLKGAGTGGAASGSGSVAVGGAAGSALPTSSAGASQAELSPVETQGSNVEEAGDGIVPTESGQELESLASAFDAGAADVAPDSSAPVFDTGPARADAASESSGERPAVLVFSKTESFRHTSIEAGITALSSMAERNQWSLIATEDATEFEASLATSNVAVFLSTTGDVFNASQERAFEAFIQAGNGYVGVHAASDTEYDWPWYGTLVGAYFKAHPPNTPTATLLKSAVAHPATTHLSATWEREDEWYGFDHNPAGEVSVVLRLDEESYEPGQSAMGGDHPIAWFHEYDGGRAFYTALGHTEASYKEPDVLLHLEGAIRWAAGEL